MKRNKEAHQRDENFEPVPEDMIPIRHLETVRRLTGPTVDTALDGLTKEEMQQVDLNDFEVDVRWKPYLANREGGGKQLLFRIRPQHWGQRSGGVWLPEGDEVDYVPPNYTPGGRCQCWNFPNG